MKGNNILLGGRPKVLIADLGVAKTFSSLASAVKGISTIAGTPFWMSPEMRNAQNLSHFNTQQAKSDIFSLGLIALYCLDTNEFKKVQPFLNENEGMLEEYLDRFRLRFTNTRLFYLIRCMLSYSPSTRPSISQLFQDLQEFLSLKPSSDSSVQTERDFEDLKPKADFSVQTEPVSLQTVSLQTLHQTSGTYKNVENSDF